MRIGFGVKTSLAMAGNHLTRFTVEGKHMPPDLLPRMRMLAERYVFGEHSRPGRANCQLITELGLPVPSTGVKGSGHGPVAASTRTCPYWAASARW